MRRDFVLCGLLALVACSSDRGRAGSGTARMVKTEELPPEQRSVLEAWRAGGSAWESERERVRADPRLAQFLVDNLIVQMVRSFDRSELGSALRPQSPFARAQAELVRLPEASVPVLVELLGVKDDIVAFLSADTLKRIGAPAVDPVASKLAAPEPEVRRRIAELLEALPESATDEPALLEKLGAAVERDEAWIVRAQAARALGARASHRTQRGYAAAVLGRALSDPDPAVQTSALGSLGSLGEAAAIPALIRRLERAASDGDLRALQASQAALRRLSGESRDHDPDGWWAIWSERGRPADPSPR
jgi:HEAT repeat protein